MGAPEKIVTVGSGRYVLKGPGDRITLKDSPRDVEPQKETESTGRLETISSS